MHKIILPAKQIPIGATVTTPKGTNEFVVAESLVIYRKRRDNSDKTRPSKIEITPEDDEVILLADGYGHIHPDDKELVWLATPEEFAAHVHSGGTV